MATPNAMPFTMSQPKCPGIILRPACSPMPNHPVIQRIRKAQVPKLVEIIDPRHVSPTP